MADQLTVSNEGRVDGEETIALTYRRLVHELEAKNPDLRLRSRTPRNLAVLFADEPTGNLDGKSGREVISLLRYVGQELGVTLILVTHDLAIAEQAGRILSLCDGAVIGDSVQGTQP